MTKKINIGETLMAMHLDELGLEFRREWKFFPGRKWRFDFALGGFVANHWEPNRIAIEIDGFFKGRHGAGWGADNEKANTATALGWRVFRFSTTDVKTGTAREFLQRWLTDKK